jgi:hypothetical protein
MAYIYGSFANVKLSKLPLLLSLLLAGTCGIVADAAAGDYDLELHTQPNPFLAGYRYDGSYAKVAFKISSGGAASILVYDFEGRLIRTLVQQRNLNSGGHEIEWDGRDDKGNLISPGPYVVVLEITIQGELYRDTFVAVAMR